MEPIDALTEEEIRHRLTAAAPPQREDENRYSAFFKDAFRPAAVLIPLLRNTDHTWHILYTRRTDLVADHKGQVAFPGGRQNSGEAYPQETALREAHEEIGLKPARVRILGQLGAIHTITNYQVVPVVGVIPWPYPVRLARREVTRVFTIPLAWLAQREHFHTQTREVSFADFARSKTLEVIYYKPYEGEVLWGVSAEITIRLLERLGFI
jgi:8-oxo-dGTP pyrophosphatase MutT (NUDIX family)